MDSDNESVDLFESDEEDFSVALGEDHQCRFFSNPAGPGGQSHPYSPVKRKSGTAPVVRSPEEDNECSGVVRARSVGNSGSHSPCRDPGTKSHLTPSPPMSRIGLNAHKAGMEGLDKEKINQIILEASKGSKFYENEVRKEHQVTRRIQSMLRELHQISEAQKATALSAADRELDMLEGTRDLGRIVVHVDMDAFYAAVEMRDDPSLRDVPMAVGGSAMLSTSNYLARRYGVRAAMPGFIAKKLCPGLVIVKTNFTKYRKVSKEVKEILAEYDPEFCSAGLDEAYLDLTDYVQKKTETGSPCRDYEPAKTTSSESISITTGYFQGKIGTGSLCRDDEPVREASLESISVATCGRGVEGEGPVVADSDCGAADRREMEQPDCGIHGSKGSSFTPSPRRSSSHPSPTAPPPSPPPPSHPPPTATPSSPPPPSHPSSPLPSSTFPRHLPPSHWAYAQSVVEELRQRIFQKTGLTASAGIACNKMLAKVASDLNKPNGQFHVSATKEAVLEFVHQLPIRKISGVGKVTEKMLNALGVTTCLALYHQRAILRLLFSPVSFQFFMQVSLGIGSSNVHRNYERKSISTERTFAELSSVPALQRKCRELCHALATDMEELRLKGRTITLKTKTVHFAVRSRAVTLPRAISSPEELFCTANQVLLAEVKACSPAPLQLRLMGVRVSSLQHEGEKRRKGQSTLEGYMTQAYRRQKKEAIGELCFSEQEEEEDDGRERRKEERGEEIEDQVETGKLSTVNLESEDSSVQVLSAVCPVCSQLVSGDNAAVNTHIDECLNCSAIKEAVIDSGSLLAMDESIKHSMERCFCALEVDHNDCLQCPHASQSCCNAPSHKHCTASRPSCDPPDGQIDYCDKTCEEALTACRVVIAPTSPLALRLQSKHRKRRLVSAKGGVGEASSGTPKKRTLDSFWKQNC